VKDEIELEHDEERENPSLPGKSKNYLRYLVPIGAGVLILGLILIFLRVSGKDKTNETLIQMEQRLAAIEQKIAALEKQQGDSARSGTVKSLEEKVERLEKRLTGSPAKTPASPKLQAAPPEKHYHVVKKGETVAKIAKRYGLSDRELRRMNKLSAKANVVPGQKLIVRLGKTDL
jgi:LysM repeat protein